VDSVAYEVLVFRRSGPTATSFDVALELGVGDALESALLPGFSLPVADLYPE
jgi:Uma2 family endonuclease